MLFDDLKNYETIVFACSGPSLNKVDVFSLGFPVAAISTTIRKITNPHIWIYSDYLNEMHGEEGKQVYVAEQIIKIVQEGKTSNHLPGKNVHAYRSFTNNRTFEAEQHLFDFSRSFARGPHKSITFGIQWAHSVGFKNIIFAGNDLSADSMESKYCYQVTQTDIKKKHNFKRTLDEVHGAMVQWYPIAKRKGYNWYSWECGQIFDNIVPKLTDNIVEDLKKKLVNKLIETKLEKQNIIEEKIETKNAEYKDSVSKYMQLISKVKKL